MGTPPKITDRDEWSPERWHSAHNDCHVWKCTDEGILVRGEKGPRRTKGEPKTLTRILAGYGDLIDAACVITGVPRLLLAALIATESGGRPDAERHEPSLKDVSIGLTQTLTATARQLAATASSALGLSAVAVLEAVPLGGNEDLWRTILNKPKISISLGACYLQTANAQWDIKWDPILCYAAYNAGSPRATDKRPWGVYYYRKTLADGRIADAMNGFAAWYGDACAVTKG